MHGKPLLACLVALLLAAAALSGPATGQGTTAGTPDEFTVGNHTFSAFVSRTATGDPDTTFQPGDTAYVIVRVKQSPVVENVSYTATIDVTPEEDNPRVETLRYEGQETGPWTAENATSYPLEAFRFNISEGAAPGTVNFTVTVTVEEQGANATDETATGNKTVTLEVLSGGAPLPPPPTPGPNWPLIGIIAFAVLVVGGAGYAVAKRRARPKPKPRSQTLQRMEVEREIERLEKRAETDTAAAAQVEALKEEQRQQEVARQKSRERMILEAKRDDAVKSMDLLRRRREAGQLTELQFNKMMEKKQEQLTQIERELSEMEARGE